MRGPRLLPILAALAGCEPMAVVFPVGDPLPVEPDAWPDDPDLVPEIEVQQRAVTCAEPGRRSKLGPFARFDDPSPPDDVGNWLWSGGIIAGDLDGDGALELVAPTQEPLAKMFQGQRGGAPVARDALEPFDLSFGIGGSVADYDDDGDLDLYVLRYQRPNVLLRNDGGGAFTDVSAQAGLDLVGSSMSASWADVDRDGDIDLFVAGYGQRFNGVEPTPSPSYLFENLGDGTFRDISKTLPDRAHSGFTMSAGFHDVNRDGWPDLYLVNDIGAVDPNLLLVNDGGTLVDDHDVAGLELATSGTGLGVGDLNGDGLPDFLLPRWHQVGLMLSDADTLTWVDHAPSVGVRAAVEVGQEVGWGAELADIDNDADLDGIVAFGHMGVSDANMDNGLYQPDALYRNDEGTFADVAAPWAIDDVGTGRGFALADLNDDGWLDVAKRDLDGPDVLYVSRCGEEAWLRVQLRKPGTNRFAIGARIAVAGNGRLQEQVIRAGGTGFGYGGPPEAHFGLADADRVRIDVLWPDGMRTRLEDVDPRQVVTIHRVE